MTSDECLSLRFSSHSSFVIQEFVIHAMTEPKSITALRHIVLLTFVALALWPVMDVVSISLRPGNRLRTTELEFIPYDATLDSYRQLLTSAEFWRWLGNSLLVSGAVTVTG